MNKFLLLFFLAFNFYINSSHQSEHDLQPYFLNRLNNKINECIGLHKELSNMISEYAFEMPKKIYAKVKANIRRKIDSKLSICQCDNHEYNLKIEINFNDTIKILKEKILEICHTKESKNFNDRYQSIDVYDYGMRKSFTSWQDLNFKMNGFYILNEVKVKNADEKVIKFEQCLSFDDSLEGFEKFGYFICDLDAKNEFRGEWLRGRGY